MLGCEDLWNSFNRLGEYGKFGNGPTISRKPQSCYSARRGGRGNRECLDCRNHLVGGRTISDTAGTPSARLAGTGATRGLGT
ncbi:hypothetical protein PITCH_A1840004 [uncultured Desulfobacterium sp.]|uniref:Uncharacterized protein n=1 Tax=uncultured Desulfobacterium sp. TaxID=201089 RepID=A0A445MVA8_9BACT|nr:hypothetical protein PITCH_A1840004 [uncultured Desulfobacterium sp.]